MSAAVRKRDLLRNSRYVAQRVPRAVRLFRFLGNKQKIRQTPYPKFFQQQAEKFGDNTLLKYDDSAINYRDFNVAANRIAHYLLSQGVGKGQTIALLMENRPEFLLYQLAISKTGAASALINSSQKGRTLVHSINLVNSDAIVVGEERLDVLADVRPELCSDRVYVVPDRNSLNEPDGEFDVGINIAAASASESMGNPASVDAITGADPAWYIYTSGTTGLPKAAVQSHAKTVKAALLMGTLINPLKPDDVTFSSLPLYHITALSVCWFAALLNGASFALARKFSASRFWDDVRRYEATSFGYVGELCRYLLNQPVSEAEKNNTIRSMTGNGLRPEIWREFKTRFGIEQINEIYGSSEGTLSACNIFNLDCTVGTPLGPYAIVEVDPETEAPVRDADGRLIKVKRGEPGLLLGKITQIAPFEGYSDRDKNESKIFRDAFKPGEHWFNTGDVLRDIGCGQLQFCDRTGDTFRWKGENVSTQEVENVLNAFAQIEESVAYGVEIPGTNGKAGMAAIKLRDSDLDTAGLFEYLERELPPYGIPVFLRLQDELEKTETFKYQKAGLKNDGFNIEAVSDPLYVALPGSRTYSPLTDEIVAGINNGKYRF